MKILVLSIIAFFSLGCISTPKFDNGPATEYLWETIAANLEGQMINPGVETAVSIRYSASVRAVGVSGQVQADTTGEEVVLDDSPPADENE